MFIPLIQKAERQIHCSVERQNDKNNDCIMEGTQWTQRTSQDRNSRCDVEKAFTSSLDISQKPDKKKTCLYPFSAFLLQQ